MAGNNIIATPSISESQGVFTTTARSAINAPADKVYHTLVNFSDYERWNAHFPFEDAASVNSNVGTKLTIYNREDAQKTELRKIEVEITEFNGLHLPYRFSYGGSLGWPRWVFYFEKVHQVTQTDDGASEVEIWETFTGYLSYIIKPLKAQTITTCTADLLCGLKDWIEQGKKVSAAQASRPE